MKKKMVKRQRNETWVLFVILGVSVFLALFMFHPSLTGNVIVGGVTCDGTWNCGDWGTCVDSSQTRICESSDTTNCVGSSPVTESQSCTPASVCDSTHLTLCLDQTTCTAATGYWYNSLCNSAPACVENWACTAWGNCSGTTQTRTCTDSNSCGTTTTKPSVSQSCTVAPVCTTTWDCGTWGTCSTEGVQTRTCADANYCEGQTPPKTRTCTPGGGTTTTTTTTTTTQKNTTTTTADITTNNVITPTVCSPNQESCANGGFYLCNSAGTGWDLKQTCELGCAGNACAAPVVETPVAPTETCNDKIKNQDETGVDCGGICKNRCSIFTLAGSVVKGPIESGKQFFTTLFTNISSNKTRMYLIFGGVGVLVAGFVAFTVFKKKIRSLVKKR
jgi:hypothetical protein